MAAKLTVIVFIWHLMWTRFVCSSLTIPEIDLEVFFMDKFMEYTYDDELIPNPEDIEINYRPQECANDLSKPRGLNRFIDFQFLKKMARHLGPFPEPRVRMSFFLFKKAFPDCGKEIRIDDNASLLQSQLNPAHQTRIIIHGWMSQGKGSFNKNVKNAYLSLDDFNVIVVDWSVMASNLNYFGVVELIEQFGAQVACFVKRLNKVMGVRFDDIYLIGHSLGAQIAGSAGKRIKPDQFNTIFALDPAAPKFSHGSDEFRIDPTDAKYVEAIQTSIFLGFMEPTGNATFYPNYGFSQKCLMPGCSHVRAHEYFAESIISRDGFWGIRCDELGLRESIWDYDVDCNTKTTKETFLMGGEPSTTKSGTFYVETNSEPPYAKGRYRKSRKLV